MKQSVKGDRVVLYCWLCECGECGCNYECQFDCCCNMKQSVKGESAVLYCRLCECGECGCNCECQCDCCNMKHVDMKLGSLFEPC